MATTSNTHTANGSTVDFAFTFPYLNSSDIKVSVDEVVQSLTTHYTLHNATTIRFGTAPANTKKVKIYRDTASTELAATFYPGSAIRSSDLNDNYTQNLYVTQEAENDASTALDNSRVLESGAYVSAISKATTAITTSNSATTTANNATTTANTASTNASTAVSTANTASTNASNAVTTANAASAAVSGKLDKSGGTMTGNITFNGSQAFDAAKITSGILPIARIDDGAITSTKLHADAVVVESEQAALTSPLDTHFLTAKASDARYFLSNDTETLESTDTWVSNNNKIATALAVDNRVTALVEEVGGFRAIANETSFPDTNPDINNNAGTLVSIKALASNLTSNGSGVATIANGNVSNSATITINGLANSTTYAAGFGLLVETTSTLHTYTFHRQLAKPTEVTTVAGISSNVTTVAGISSNVTSVANNASNISSVAANASNINSVAGNATNINSVAGNASNINSAVSNASNINAAVSNAGNINAVAGQIVHAEDLGLITESLTSESGNNINTVANNINDINSFSDQYKVASSTPGSPSQGDLWYDSSNTILKYYNGSSWLNISAGGILNLVEDTTPELGGHLDCNDKNITYVATVSGTNLQIDFGALA